MCDCSGHNGFLTAKGLAEAAQRLSLEGLAPRGESEYLDMVGSVSGLGQGRDRHMWPSDSELLEQSERFLNGS